MTEEQPQDESQTGQLQLLTRSLKQERSATMSALGLGSIAVFATSLADTLKDSTVRRGTYGVGFVALGAGIVTALGALSCAKEVAAIERDMYHQRKRGDKSWVESARREPEMESAHSR